MFENLDYIYYKFRFLYIVAKTISLLKLYMWAMLGHNMALTFVDSRFRGNDK